MRRPAATSGRIECFCASVPASRMASAPRTALLKCGPGTGPRPNSSNRTPASVYEPPSPPYSVGMIMPSQPVATNFDQGSDGAVCPVADISSKTSLGYSVSTNRRTAVFSISCSSVRDKSIVYGSCAGTSVAAQSGKSVQRK